MAIARTRADGSEGDVAREELLRAARVLSIRSRREATGLFTGSYASAFRGGGMIFEESRPYSPGDDVRRMDWNAMARTGEPFVKHFHEERDRTVLIVLDTSASMAFPSPQRSLARTGAHAAALIGAVAGRTGDRVGLVTFGEGPPTEVPPARGLTHAWQVVEAVARASQRPGGAGSLDDVQDLLHRRAEGGAIVFLVSDFRSSGGGEAPPAIVGGLAARHDVVAVVVHDPRDVALPSAGRVRIADPERRGRTLLLDTRSARVRRRYASLAEARRRALGRALRTAGSDVVWLSTAHDPLRALLRFFGERSARVGVGPA